MPVLHSSVMGKVQWPQQRSGRRTGVARVLAQHSAQHAVGISGLVILEQQLSLAQSVARDLPRRTHTVFAVTATFLKRGD